MNEPMTKEELLTHIDEMERASKNCLSYLATADYRLLDATGRHVHANTLIQQIAYHAMLVDQLQMRFTQHQAQEAVK